MASYYLIRNTSGLVKKTDFNSKITEIEGKIPTISDKILWEPCNVANS